MQSAGIGLGPQTPDERRRQAYALRENTAGYYRSRRSPLHRNNGDESKYENLHSYASFIKGLPHDHNGEVVPAAYAALLAALQSGEPRDFESVPLGSASLPKPRRLLLVNPQAGLAFDLEGIDPQQVTSKPAYAFNSAGEIGEIAENYWMALCRDIPFTATRPTRRFKPLPPIFPRTRSSMGRKKQWEASARSRRGRSFAGLRVTWLAPICHSS